MRHFLRSESLSTSQYNGPLSLKTICFPFISSTWNMRKIIKMKSKHWSGFKRATSDTLRILVSEEWLTSFVVRKMEFALWQSYTFRCAGRRLRIALVDANAILLNSGPFFKVLWRPLWIPLHRWYTPPPSFRNRKTSYKNDNCVWKAFLKPSQNDKTFNKICSNKGYCIHIYT